MRAVEGFDPRRGFRFSTYATWWIRHFVQRCIANTSRTIRLPVHTHTTYNKLGRSAQRLAQQIGRRPSAEELARTASVPIATVEQIRAIAPEPQRLESPRQGRSDIVLADLLAHPDSFCPEELAEAKERRSRVADLLKHLSPREQYIVRARYGINEKESEETLQAIGRRLGLSRERVRQLEVVALNKMRLAAKTSRGGLNR